MPTPEQQGYTRCVRCCIQRPLAATRPHTCARAHEGARECIDGELCVRLADEYLRTIWWPTTVALFKDAMARKAGP